MKIEKYVPPEPQEVIRLELTAYEFYNLVWIMNIISNWTNYPPTNNTAGFFTQKLSQWVKDVQPKLQAFYAENTNYKELFT